MTGQSFQIHGVEGGGFNSALKPTLAVGQILPTFQNVNMGYIIPFAMTSDQYKLALSELRLGQRDVARFLGVHPDTGKKWAQNGPPPPIAKWVRYLVATRASPADIDAAIARG